MTFDVSRTVMPNSIPTRALRLFSALAVAGTVVGASQTQFTSTWREPAARANFEGKKIAAFFVGSNQDMRRTAENAMAQELTSAGARGMRGYELLTNEVTKDVEKALDVLKHAGIEGVLLTRILEPTVQPTTIDAPDTTPRYASLSAYWGSVWAGVTDPLDLREGPTAAVETFLYATSDGKPVWAGIAEVEGASNLTKSVIKLAETTVKQLTRRSIIRNQP